MHLQDAALKALIPFHVIHWTTQLANIVARNKTQNKQHTMQATAYFDAKHQARDSDMFSWCTKAKFRKGNPDKILKMLSSWKPT